ncbi:MAG TPA: PadR family transcriptional regulator [Acidobacteriaceae bacterium]|jgi:PadR family transcriptional regulator, regulatory protein AphA|nr:PadR family transcriptional regulator [Acidobacteriaceae bacterium]
MKTSPSTLEHAILGMLSFQPRSGYDVRRAFLTNLRYYSDSPGTIYPALRRLETRRWIESAPAGQVGAESRSRRPFTLTPAGRQELIAWLEQPIAEGDFAQRLSELFLRFTYMGANIPREKTLGFLRDLEAGLTARAAEQRRKYDEVRKVALPFHTGVLSMLLGVETTEAQARWAGTALALLEEKSA